MRKAFSRVFAGLIAAVVGLTAAPSHAQTPFVDTGSGNASGGHALFNSPPNFNLLACQFTQGSAFTIGTVQGWMVRPSGTLTVKLCANNGSNLPGTVLASQNFSVTFSSPATWASFVVSGAAWRQPAGTYWICFEPTTGTTGGSMPGNVPNPLPRTAFFTNGNPGYVANGAADLNGRYGLRLYPPAPPAPINVPADQPTIQAGINAANLPLQEVIVAPGTYNEAINFTGKTIIVRSSGGAAVTTIDATGLNLPAVQMPSGSTTGTRLEGFTVRGGSATTGLAEGGGVLAQGATASVKNCIITQNSAGNGGGGAAMIFSANITFDGCTLSSNTAGSGSTGSGGGAYVNGATASFINNCAFNSNTCGSGGGGLNINNNGIVTVTGCTFTGNISNNAGGAVVIIGSGANGTFNTCTFNNSTAVQAGAVMVNGAAGSFTSCGFNNNTATFTGGTSGGGLQAQGTGTLTVNTCTFTGNHGFTGAGLQLLVYTGTANITGSTFTSNIATSTGGGLVCNNGASGTISGCHFNTNQASSGGGVFVGASGNTLGIGTTTFCGNTPDGVSGPYTNNGGNTLTCDPADTNGDGHVNVDDLLSVITHWGACPGACPPHCAADVAPVGPPQGDCVVNVNDLLVVITHWG